MHEDNIAYMNDILNVTLPPLGNSNECIELNLECIVVDDDNQNHEFSGQTLKHGMTTSPTNVVDFVCNDSTDPSCQKSPIFKPDLFHRAHDEHKIESVLFEADNSQGSNAAFNIDSSYESQQYFGDVDNSYFMLTRGCKEVQKNVTKQQQKRGISSNRSNCAIDSNAVKSCGSINRRLATLRKLSLAEMRNHHKQGNHHNEVGASSSKKIARFKKKTMLAKTK